ncbi:MAG: nicotinate phosphoribosyltransferase [Clostridiales Family XIII bacterium]|jgi:nicotinate phosphoribosyltransferase|nr:nicotinate phosphoribosyltransferase [Clostridiales Family XIII bacterium]
MTDMDTNTANMTLLTDFYELTMANGYFESGVAENIAYFDLFFRNIPDGGGFAIAAGLEQAVEYLETLKFTEDDIAFLKGRGIFKDAFLDYLRNFKFTCDVWAIPEGTPVFPGEPLVTVRGPMAQAQFVETMLLLIINHQSLIATKANRIVRAAAGRGVMEFGTRRAHGASAAIYGARAAFIGGCIGTACAITGREYPGIPAIGTMAHSWVQMFDSEYEAFRRYAEIYPDNCVLLVDTYNVVKSGIPNAVRVFNELKPKKTGIRLDSGDVTYLSKQARKMLDDAGFPDCIIVVSNSLDEYIIRDVILQGARIDMFGVGERLITSKSDPVFGGVYKLSAIETDDGRLIPKMKISENVEKITNPGFKKVYRLFSKKTNKVVADIIALDHENIPDDENFVIFDPAFTWKRKKLSDFYAKDLRVPIFDKGKRVYDNPSIGEIQAYCKAQVDTLWEESLRFENPTVYYVDLSTELWNLRTDLIHRYQKDFE